MKRILKSSLSAIFLFLSVLTTQAQSSTTQTGKPLQVERWIKSQFGKGKTPPFSFEYGGQPSSTFLSKCKHSLTRLPSKENQVCYIATYTDSKTGLKVECEVTGWMEFGVWNGCYASRTRAQTSRHASAMLRQPTSPSNIPLSLLLSIMPMAATPAVPTLPHANRRFCKATT